MNPVLRIVRHCTGPTELAAQYRAVLRMDEQGSFDGHEGYAATFSVGQGQAGISHSCVRHDPVHRCPRPKKRWSCTSPDSSQWQQRVTDLERAGFVRTSSPNPYWNENGASFSDIEGFRVIVARLQWP